MAGSTLVLSSSLLPLALFILSGCHSRTPDLDGTQSRPLVVTGKPFRHWVAERGVSGGRLLHVYLEGDGRPWITRKRVAFDPSPQRSLMLPLMAQDPAPSIYLGRPCYFVSDPNCAPIWWTHQRYAPEVIESLDHVLDRYAANFDAMLLIGHSGGGALAMLLAARRDDVVGVITLAGNLDTSAWTRYHGYSRLEGSLNPAELPALKASLRQHHYLGADDSNIKASMLEGPLMRQDAKLTLITRQDHNCCWDQIWPTILHRMALDLAEEPIALPSLDWH